jgi:hypothetical protein
VQPINQIDISVARRTEKDGIVSLQASEGVRSGIGKPEVGFGFRDPACESFTVSIMHENLAEQGSGNLIR